MSKPTPKAAVSPLCEFKPEASVVKNALPKVASILWDIVYENEGLNKLEMRSIDALIAYTAMIEKTSEAAIRSMVETQFNVADIKKLGRRVYDDVIRYLVDLNAKAIIN